MESTARNKEQSAQSNPSTSKHFTNLRTIVRQNSQKFEGFAENVILPPSRRSVKRQERTKERESQVQDNAGGTIPYALSSQHTTISVPENNIQNSNEFPLLIFMISAIQVLNFYTISTGSLWLYLGMDPYRRYELWRYVTYMLEHASPSHLWGNVVLQLILGVLLELVHGKRRIFAIYIAAVVGGALFHTVISPKGYAIGASGGVWGLFMAHLSTIILNWNEMDKKICRLFWFFAYVVVNVALTVYVEMNSISTNVAHDIHIGGAITGFLVAILTLRNFEKHPWEKDMQKFCAAILIVLFAVVVLINLTTPSNYFNAAWNFQYENTYTAHRNRLIVETCEQDESWKRFCAIYNITRTSDGN